MERERKISQLLVIEKGTQDREQRHCSAAERVQTEVLVDAFHVRKFRDWKGFAPQILFCLKLVALWCMGERERERERKEREREEEEEERML